MKQIIFFIIFLNINYTLIANNVLSKHSLGGSVIFNRINYEINTLFVSNPAIHLNENIEKDLIKTKEYDTNLYVYTVGLELNYQYLFNRHSNLNAGLYYNKFSYSDSFKYSQEQITENYYYSNLSNIKIESGFIYGLNINGNYNFYKSNNVNIYFIYGADISYTTINLNNSYFYLANAQIINKSIPTTEGSGYDEEGYISPADLVAKAYPNLVNTPEKLKLPKGNFNLSAETLCVQTLATDLQNGYNKDDKTNWPFVKYTTNENNNYPANSSFKLLSSEAVNNEIINIKDGKIKNPEVRCKFADMQTSTTKTTKSNIKINTVNLNYNLGLGVGYNLTSKLKMFFETKFNSTIFNHFSNKYKQISTNALPVVENLKFYNTFILKVGLIYNL